MVKYFDECISHNFTRFIYKSENDAVLSNPKLRYQKANGIVKKFIEKDPNRINILKYKTEKNFKMIQYVYSLLYPKIYNRINNFGIQNKSSFDFAFSNWTARKKNNGPVTPNIINELPASTKQVLVTEMLSKPKNPKDYKDREVNEFEQAPLYFEQPVNLRQQPKLKIETIEIKKEIVKTDSRDKTDGFAKKMMEVRAAKRRAEGQENLQRQLSGNTAKMNILKNLKFNKL